MTTTKHSSRTVPHVGIVIMNKVLIAMSGGVDSSVAAFLIKSGGYDCIGCTMKLYHNEDIGVSKAHTCCSLDDIEDARAVAYRLNMPYHVFNFSDDFREKVMEKFVRSYEAGLTPNPCIDCNRYMKFDKLFDRAKVLGCDYVVTGHYARIEQEDGRFLLKKALDLTKDQSYVLYAMTQEQLAHTLFPLGSLSKTETRRIAEKQGFTNASKPDSQDICFVPDGDYASFMERYTEKTYPIGDFLDESGNVVGQHHGAVQFTIGQRKGLGLAMGAPVYVFDKNMEKNTVSVGEEKLLYKRALIATDINWIAFDTPSGTFRVKAKTRYRQVEQPATVTVMNDGRITLEFDEPQRAITPGQAVVLYDDDTVLGGGTILKVVG